MVRISYRQLRVFAMLSAVGISMLGASAARAQKQPPAPPPGRMMPLLVRLIIVVFTVHDKRGENVRGLQAADFRIFEDGQPREVGIFDTAGTSIPMSIGLLIDCSASRRKAFPKLGIDPTALFLGSVVDDNHAAFLAAFSDTVAPLGDYSNDPAQLEHEVQRIGTATPAGGTALYDAIVWAATKLSSRRPYAYKVLVIVAQGDDNDSRIRSVDAARTALKAGVAVYFIQATPLGMPSEETRRAGDFTKALATNTGGQLFDVRETDGIQRAFANVADDLQNVYMIGYVPEASIAGGAFHKIKIEVMKKGLHISAPAEFFVPKDAENKPNPPN